MVVLYIIGAGCSRNFSECTSPVPDLKPPLNKDFFKMAKKVVDYYNLSQMYSPIPGLDHFTRNLNRMYGYGDSQYDTSVYDDDRLDLESVMTHFYAEHELLDFSEGGFRSLLPRSRGHRILALKELLAYTITESLKGPICRKHRCLAEKVQKGDVVWSFNYDLLMDNALREQGKLTDSGYIMRFDYTLVEGNWERFADVPSDVTMLKLHGSLNWLRCTVCGCNLLLRDQKSVPELPITGIGGILIMTCPNCSEISDIPSLERIIIPPSLVKSFGEVEIRYLWKYAGSLKHIDRLKVIGFRFAEQDPEVEMLLRNMFQYGRIPPDVPIHIVNPNPEKVEARFNSVFRKSRITHESPSSFFKNSS